jgi:hypothetical protein
MGTKKMVNRGLKKADIPKTNNGPSGYQRTNLVRIHKNPIVPQAGKPRVIEHGRGSQRGL